MKLQFLLVCACMLCGCSPPIASPPIPPPSTVAAVKLPAPAPPVLPDTPTAENLPNVDISDLHLSEDGVITGTVYNPSPKAIMGDMLFKVSIQQKEREEGGNQERIIRDAAMWSGQQISNVYVKTGLHFYPESQTWICTLLPVSDPLHAAPAQVLPTTPEPSLVRGTPAPASPPADATALCNDGTYSYALNHRGACSHHGGVLVWYK